MERIINVYHNLALIASCSESCYDAQHEECSCICVGHCHGHGLAIATTKVLENSIQIVASIQDQFPDHTHTVLTFPLAKSIVPNLRHADQAHPNGRPARPHPSISPGTPMDPGP